jgi:hypothetical protein
MAACRRNILQTFQRVLFCRLHRTVRAWCNATTGTDLTIRESLALRNFTYAALAVLSITAAGTSALAEQDYKLPPEVTPQLRAACESDVRRLCIGTNPTVAKVKVCVASKFMQLGKRCQMQLAIAGFKR